MFHLVIYSTHFLTTYPRIISKSPFTKFFPKILMILIVLYLQGIGFKKIKFQLSHKNNFKKFKYSNNKTNICSDINSKPIIHFLWKMLQISFTIAFQLLCNKCFFLISHSFLFLRNNNKVQTLHFLLNMLLFHLKFNYRAFLWFKMYTSMNYLIMYY